jgi:hypothetical protein
MTWTEPKTWTNEPLIASDMNTHIRDNLEALKDPPSNSYVLNESANFTTSSATFTNVDPLDTDGKLRLEITTSDVDVMVSFNGVVNNNTNPGSVYFTLSVDGTIISDGGDDGIIGLNTNSGTLRIPVSFTRLITGLSAGPHIFRLMWKVTTATTGTLYAGAGTANADFHPQFWAREVS